MVEPIKKNLCGVPFRGYVFTCAEMADGAESFPCTGSAHVGPDHLICTCSCHGEVPDIGWCVEKLEQTLDPTHHSADWRTAVEVVIHELRRALPGVPASSIGPDHRCDLCWETFDGPGDLADHEQAEEERLYVVETAERGE